MPVCSQGRFKNFFGSRFFGLVTLNKLSLGYFEFACLDDVNVFDLVSFLEQVSKPLSMYLGDFVSNQSIVIK